MTPWREQILEALNRAGVRYLVVGGVAVVLHGIKRYTGDLDLVIELEAENVRKAMGALTAAGVRPKIPVPVQSFADAAQREAWIRDKHMLVFQFWSERDPMVSLDVFVREPFDFASTYARAARLKLEGADATVVSLRDLIEMKRAAGRPKDLQDCDDLQDLLDPDPNAENGPS